MTKEYDSNSEREYTAPESPRIVEPEPMISKIPKWVKYSILWSVGLYLCLNASSFFLASSFRSAEMSKSEIEEKIDKAFRDKGLEKFVFDDLAKNGRELSYSIFGDGEEEK